MNRFRSLTLAGGITALAGALMAALPLSASAEPSEQRLAFDVFLNERAIGTHRFDIRRDEDLWAITSDAAYDVRILFFNAYRYRHRAEEQWQDGCLTRIRSSTDDDGDTIELSGERGEQGLRVTVNGATTDLDHDCVASFAYWHPEWLDRARLLNPQTGDLEAVALSGGELAPLPWQDTRTAYRYQLETPEAPIELWYDRDGRWIGLRSRLESGHTVTYRAAEPERAALSHHLDDPS